MNGRAMEPLTKVHLAHLGELARLDREGLFSRVRMREAHRSRLLCVALCQGGALHWIDRKNGVKDLDVFSFYAKGGVSDYPPRRRGEGHFGLPGLTDWSERVDMMGRSIAHEEGQDGVASVLRYLTMKPTGTAWHLAQKAVVIIEPMERLGEVIWPPQTPSPSL